MMQDRDPQLGQRDKRKAPRKGHCLACYVASDQQPELKVLFFGFGGEVAVSVIAVSSTEGSSAAWTPTMHPASSLSAYSR
jgi:hypothetical protein